jgi:uncharacterized membrane protein
MPSIVTDLLGLLGIIIRFAGFLVFGFAIGRFVWDNFKTSVWQVQAALILGFFGAAIGFTDFASAGSAGAFALGSGAAFLMANMPKKENKAEEK